MIDLVIVGGGPAGLAAAYSAWQHGLRDILILERDNDCLLYTSPSPRDS